MQQYNIILAMLCQHIDIKASIFLSFVAIVLFVYAYGPFGNPVILVLGLGFALAYPIRIGVKMLSSRPLQTGGGDLDVSELFEMDESDELAAQRRMAVTHKKAIRHNSRGKGAACRPGLDLVTHKKAIRHNSRVLKKKHRQNTDLIITSLMLFGYLMGMTVLFMFIAPPGA